MTPWGHYKFIMAFMGCSGDEYSRRADVAFGSLSNTVLVVDDLLWFVHTFPVHVAGVCAILQTARTASIPFSRGNFRFVRSRLSWVGYNVQHGGFTIKERKLKALSEFHQPNNFDRLWVWSSSWLLSLPKCWREKVLFAHCSAPATLPFGQLNIKLSKLLNRLWSSRCWHISILYTKRLSRWMRQEKLA